MLNAHIIREVDGADSEVAWPNSKVVRVHDVRGLPQ